MPSSVVGRLRGGGICFWGCAMKTEVNIQDLLDKIKKEGVEEANKQSQEILDKARLEAEAIVKEAKEEAERTLTLAREEVRRKQEAFEQELSQSGRNLILGVKQEIISLMDRILRREVRSALTSDVLRELIVKLVDRWNKDEEFQGVEVLLSEEERKLLEDAVFHALQEELRKGVSLKPVRAVGAGFRMGEKDGDLHYDFTDRGIAEVLSEYLNPRVAKFLTGASGDKETKR